MRCPTWLQVWYSFQRVHSIIVLYEYTNKEMDIAAACFRIGNYYSLRDMPDDFTANNVNQAMRERLEKAQIISAINAQNRKIYASLCGGGGLFHKFEWMVDEFELRKTLSLAYLTNN
jgi:hypothetical protein